jgi:hypothetical protein
MSRPATEAASCSAVRTTLVGSMMPAFTMSPYSPVWASKPKLKSLTARASCRPRPSVDAGVLGDLTDRRLQRLAADDVDAGLLVVVVGLDAARRLLGAQQRDAAARHDAFLDRGAGGVQRVVDAVLALLHLDFGRAADADHRNAAGQLGQTLLQLLRS